MCRFCQELLHVAQIFVSHLQQIFPSRLFFFSNNSTEWGWVAEWPNKKNAKVDDLVWPLMFIWGPPPPSVMSLLHLPTSFFHLRPLSWRLRRVAEETRISQGDTKTDRQRCQAAGETRAAQNSSCQPWFQPLSEERPRKRENKHLNFWFADLFSEVGQ